jgi:carbonic anhydrase
VEEAGGSNEANFIPFLTFTDLRQSVVEDVQRIRNHPLVSSDIPIYGYIYDVKTGKLNEVTEATELGRAYSRKNALGKEAVTA